MPYERLEDLPEQVRNALPKAAQRVFRAAFNSAMEQYDDEARAFATAWAAVRRAGWEKGEDGRWHRVEKVFLITKADEEQRLVFGWASVAEIDGKPIVDSQDDIIPIDELEKAVYAFISDVRKVGHMHEEFVGVGEIVESCVFTKEKYESMGIDPEGMPLGWWVGMRIEKEEVWKDIKTGKLRAFSIGGKAVREPVK